MPPPDISRPDPGSIDKYLEQLSAFRAGRDHGAVQRSLDELAFAFYTADANTYGKVVDAVRAGATHGEICARVRDVVGFGHPYVSV